MKKNLSRLLPFVGFLFVIAGVIGLIFVQKPLDNSQELRSDASEIETTTPLIVATNPDQTIYVDEDSQISLDLNTGNHAIEKVSVLFNIITSNTTTPVVTVNAGSGLRATAKEVEDVADGYLVSLVAVPNSIIWETQPNDVSFIKINFTPTQEGDISINFDEDNTYIETPEDLYSIDVETMNFEIKLEEIEEEQDDDYLTINQCDQQCNSNIDCDINYRCFDTGSKKVCRLATNPSSEDCSTLPNLGPNKQCGEYCADSNDCTQGLSCWYNECRNPENVEDVSCLALTKEEMVASVNSCGESCSSNADCAVNLRCYDSVCRLVTNPSSLTCSATTKKTVSTIYENKQKGDNIIPDEEKNYNKVDDIGSTNRDNTTMDKNDEVPVDETALDFVLKMLKDKQQSLPTTVILIGIGLLAASLILLLISKLFGKKPKRYVEDHSLKIDPTLEVSQDTKVKDLLDKLKEQSKNENQG